MKKNIAIVMLAIIALVCFGGLGTFSTRSRLKLQGNDE